jgi:hypothetical protein
VPGLRLATATASTPAQALKITRDEMIRVMHDEPAFSDFFLKFMLARSMRTQADLVDQLFNSSEKRLARILLLMAEFGKPGERETFHSSHFAGNPGGDDRHHAVSRQLLHESLSQARLYQLQRPHPGAQVAAQCGPSRPAAGLQRSLSHEWSSQSLTQRSDCPAATDCVHELRIAPELRRYSEMDSRLRGLDRSWLWEPGCRRRRDR